MGRYYLLRGAVWRASRVARDTQPSINPSIHPSVYPSTHLSIYPSIWQAKQKAQAPTGLFAPLVVGMKVAMGEKELNRLRYDLIERHSKVISYSYSYSHSSYSSSSYYYY